MTANWSLFTEVLMAEAGEAHVKYHAFSLLKFIRFSCSGRHPANSLTNRVHVHPDYRDNPDALKALASNTPRQAFDSLVQVHATCDCAVRYLKQGLRECLPGNTESI